jgi:flagellar basal body-associated protein FliL
MSLDPLLKTQTQVLQNFRSLNFQQILAHNTAAGNWNNLTLNELLEGLTESLDLIQRGIDSNSHKFMTFTILNNINTHLINTYNYLVAFTQNPNQPNYQQFGNQLEALRTYLRNSGYYFLVYYSPNIPEISDAVSKQLEKLTQGNKDNEALKEEIKNLISPAIAGQFSRSFAERGDFIFKNRMVSLILLILSLGASGWYTFDLIERVNKVIQFELQLAPKISNDQPISAQEQKNNAAKNPPASKENSEGASSDRILLIIFIVLRSLILIPIYIIVKFFLNQYAKERDIEENYAHKQTVSATLKTYRELLGDSVAKDSITIKASEVLYSSPNQQAAKELKKEKPESTESLTEKIAEKIISKIPGTK